MEHSHPIEPETLCPYCATCPGTCCKALERLRKARRGREKRQYDKNPEKFRKKALRHYRGRATKPPGVSGPLDPPTAP